MRIFTRPAWCKQSRLPWRLPKTTQRSHVPRRIVTTSTLNSAPVDIPKLVIRPGSALHNSLPSFLEYAKRTNLASTKTYYVGTHYEYIAALALLRLGFSLLRTGKKSDAGIDLVGHWVLAPLCEPLPVIVQCKARKISCRPSHVRELEGSFRGIPAEWTNKNVLGLLVTTQKATRGVLEAFGKSQWPMGFVLISRTGIIQQFVWNRAASEKGLEGVGVTLRHGATALLPDIQEQGEEDIGWSHGGMPRKAKKTDNASVGIEKDIQLTWMGSPIFPDRRDLDQETLRLTEVIASENEHKGDHTGGGENKMKTSPTRRCGRPRGSKNRKTISVVSDHIPKKSGILKGAKNNETIPVAIDRIPKKLGLPKSSKNAKTIMVASNYVSKKPGRPKGSRNKSAMLVDNNHMPKKRGRPKGSKNKIKAQASDTAAGGG